MSEIPNQRHKPNYFTNIVSVSLVLVLLGFFGIAIIHTQQLVRLFKEKVNVLMEIKPNTETAALEEVENYLVNAEFVKSGSVKFTDKETAAELMAEEFGEQFVQLDLPNPYYDVFTFNVTENHFSMEEMSEIRNDLRQFAAVRDVYYQEDFLQVLGRNISKLGWLAFAFGILFLVVAVVLIHNTIRIALYANRLTIKNMELVGASWEFISRPYLWRSFWHGLVSSIIAILILNGMLWYVYQSVPELADLQNKPLMILLFISLLVLGVLISIISTYVVVNKYLKLRVDEVY